MKVEMVGLEGVLVITPDKYEDNRGLFFETYNDTKFRDLGLPPASSFVQDNESRSHCGVLRGLHFQRNPYSQGKLVGWFLEKLETWW